jgi:hypothetical protein
MRIWHEFTYDDLCMNAGRYANEDDEVYHKKSYLIKYGVALRKKGIIFYYLNA